MKSSALLKLFFFVFLLFPVVADALEIPQPKLGLWEIRMTNPYGAGPKVITSQICWDAAWEKRTKTAEESMKKDCSKLEVHMEGGKWITNSVCKVGDSTATTQGTFEYNGENAYHTVTDMTFNPPTSGMASMHSVKDAKWLGPCK